MMGFGWDEGGDRADGSLSDRDFVYEGDTYNLVGVWVANDALKLTFRGGDSGDFPTQKSRDYLTLHVGEDQFDLEKGIHHELPNGDGRIILPFVGLSWTKGDSVALKITEMDYDPMPPIVTVERITGKESALAYKEGDTPGSVHEDSWAHFRIRVRGNDGPFEDSDLSGIKVGIAYEFKSPPTSPCIVAEELALLRRTQAEGSVRGNRFWDVNVEMFSSELHEVGPMRIKLVKIAGEPYSLGAESVTCIVIHDPDTEAGGEPCTSSGRVGSEGPPLTADFDGLPDSHDGENPFSFRIEFSEDINVTAEDMRDHVLEVDRGTVTAAARVDERDDLWSFEITPWGDSAVRMYMSGGVNCQDSGAICTSEGKQLSGGLSARVSGPLPTVSVRADGEAIEGVDTSLAFIVSVDHTKRGYVYVDYATSDDTATEGDDYDSRSGTLMFTANTKSYQVEVPIIDDEVEDDGERFTLNLSNARNAIIGDGSAIGIIRNSEGDPVVSVADAEATEGVDGLMHFTISVEGVPVSGKVDYATSDGTATVGHDYTATSGTWNFLPRHRKITVAVPIRHDAKEEEQETFKFMLRNATGAGIADGEAVGTIHNGAPPQVSVETLWSADMSVVEYTSVSIGADSADLFSNIGGSANLTIKSLWTFTPDRELYLKFEEAVSDTSDLSLQAGDLTLAFPEGSAAQQSFKWKDVDVDWEDGQTVAVRVVRGLEPSEKASNTVATGVPTISGTAQAGEMLTAGTSAIADLDGLNDVEFFYQWLAEDAPILGASNSSYTLTKDDVGKTIKVRVTFIDETDNEETVTSAATTRVTAGPNSPATGAPTISGTVQAGETLTGTTSGIADTDGLSAVEFSYQWLADDADIQEATGSTYTLTDAEVGKTIKVRVTFTDDASNEESLTSVATTPVTAAANNPATGLPTITGTAQAGETLTVDTSGISDADGLDNVEYGYQWLADDADIQDTTASTYTLTDADMGKAIKVRVAFTDDADNDETLTSVATTPVTAAANNPATGLPTISGTAQEGKTLTAGTSGIADADGLDNVSYSYQWLADDADIQDATASTYTLTDAEVGKAIKVKVTFTDDKNNQETLTSGTTAAVAAASGPLTGFTLLDASNQAVLATPEDGDEVSLDDPSGGNYAIRADVDSSAAIGSVKLELTGAKTLTQTESISPYSLYGDDGTSALHGGNLPVGSYTLRSTAYSEGAGAGDELGVLEVFFTVAASNSPATGAPTISGTVQADHTLTAGTSGIADADGLTNVEYSYQWLADDTDIQSATNSTYVLTGDEVGKTIKVKVTFTDDADNEETLTSVATTTVTAAANNQTTGLPTINGTAQAGETLTADTSGISDADGLTNVSYSYQWVADDAEISDATSSTYVLTGDEVGKTIKVKVTFTDDADNEETLTSAATTTVTAAANNPATGLPTITGTAQAGETLTASTSSIADADGLTNVEYSYQWLADDAEISGATNSTYNLTGEEVGKAIKVKVTFTDDADNDETLISAATGTVAAAPVPLTVSLENKPTSHDGTNDFSFDIRFSEEFDLSYKTLKFHAFDVSGGSVQKAQRLQKEPESDIGWKITVRPDGNGDVTVVLPITTDCSATGAICTGDGRMLSNRLEFTVSGPGG